MDSGTIELRTPEMDTAIETTRELACDCRFASGLNADDEPDPFAHEIILSKQGGWAWNIGSR
jgi:hypothetical protein